MNVGRDVRSSPMMEYFSTKSESCGGQNNPDPSEGPWGRWSIPPHGGAVIASTDPTLCGSTLKHEGRRQTDRRSADAGSRLKLIDASGRSRLIRQPFSRNGENSPYGMLGGIVETSASFEARSAPRSYPTHERLKSCTATPSTRSGYRCPLGVISGSEDCLDSPPRTRPVRPRKPT